MSEELDIRQHPKINIKRTLVGMDMNAGLIAILGAVVGVLIGGSGFLHGNKILAAIGGFTVAVGAFTFAKKFIHAKPPTYITDWLQSKLQPNFSPKKRFHKK